MSDTAGFPLVGGALAFPGKNNLVRDGAGSNAFGWDSQATGQTSFVGGRRCRATGDQSFSFGSSSIASGSQSLAVGNGCSATAAYAAAFGNGCTSSGVQSFSFGQNSTASGALSFAANSTTTASNTGSSAFGSNTWASGQNSIAAGTGTTASGTNSSAFGTSCQAQGNSSIAMGSYAIATNIGEFAQSSSRIAADADCQRGSFTMNATTTSATPARMAMLQPSTYKPIPAGGSWAVTVDIIARTNNATGKSARFVRSLQIDRTTTTAIVGSVQTVGTDTGTNSGAVPAGWSVSITADTSTPSINVTVTGDTSTIYWAASVFYTQVILA